MTTAEQLVRRAAADPDTGLGPIRRALALGLSGADGNRYGAREYAAERWPNDVGVELALQRKSAVDPMDTSITALQPSPDAAAFVSLVRSREIFSQLSLRRVPLARGGAVLQSSGVSVGWVDEARPIPVTLLELGRASLDPRKLAAIVAVTRELAEFSDPSAERLIRDDLAAATATEASTKFLSDDAAADGAPAGITEGITPTASSSDIVEDVMVALSGLSRLDDVAVIMPVEAKLLLDTKRGGSLVGFPVIGTDAAAGRIIALDQSRILFGDSGIAIDSTEHAMVVMEDAPSESIDGDTVYVSLWQMGLLGLRSIRFVNWERAADDAVAVISGATYTS